MLTSILALLGPKIIGIMAVVLGAIGLAFQQRLAGAKAERAKQAQKEAGARDIADQVDNDIGALPPETARKELSKWSKG